VRILIAAAMFTLILAAGCSPLAAQATRPIFLYSLEAKGVPTGTIHVYGVNSSTGGITEVPGSPFNAGLIPQQLVVDPTGRFVYVTNNQSEDITAFSVDPASGALTELPGSPFAIGATPVVAGIDSTARFLYVFAASAVNGVQQELLYEYIIDSVTGVLTAASSSPTTWESQPGPSYVSIAFNPAGNYAYLGQVVGDNLGAPTVICAVDFSTGALSGVGGVQPAVTGEAQHVAVSPSGSLLYSVNSSFNQLDAFTVDPQGGSFSEILGSPYPTQNFPSALVVHPTGNFLYVANENQPYQTNYLPSQYAGTISAFAINAGTGALTDAAGSPFAAGINPTSIVVDPTGSFAYTGSTKYTSGYSGLSQILGYSINSGSGVLTPFSGTPWTDSVESVGAQLAISYGPSTSLNPAPTISSLSPSSVAAGGAGFALQVTGTNFVPGTTVYFGGQPRSTTFINATLVTAIILNTDIENGGNAIVFVFSPLPGGGASTSLEFPVNNPTPVIASLSPSTIPAAATAFDLFVIGSGFVTSSVVNFNGAALATSYGGPTLLIVEILTSQILVPGTATITVTNPPNGVTGGGTSNSATLTISTAISPLNVSSISPASTMSAGPAFSLMVNGSGFVQGSQVSFNQMNVPTTFVTSTQLTASIPASAIAIAGNPYVIVTNPNGTTSVALTFAVNNPQPVGGSVSSGNNALTLNVTGTGFTQSSVVYVGGSPRATTFVSSTLLVATLLPTDLSQGGTLIITVMNPPPGGGTSPIIGFAVPNPLPQESTLSPSSTQAGSAALTLNVTGSNFVGSSKVLVNGAARTTTFVSATALQAALPVGDLSQAGTLNVSVNSPTPGGGTTAALPFTVIAGNPVPQASLLTPGSAQVDSAALTLTVSGSNFIASSNVLVNGAARTTTFVSSTLLQAALPASDLSQAGTLSVSVKSPTPGGGTTAALPFTVDDFAVTAPTSPETVTAGEPAVFSLMVAPLPSGGTYSKPITLSATGLPTAGAIATFAPLSPATPITAPQAVTLTITTTAHSETSMVDFPPGARPGAALLCLVGIAIALAGLSLRASNSRRQLWAPQLLLALLIISAAGLVGCGAVGAGPTSPPQPDPATGTPAGTYTIKVIAISGGVSHPTTVTLTVK
jgi:6-phosphogluconolactonase (cycloisomerase 2 family)